MNEVEQIPQIPSEAFSDRLALLRAVFIAVISSWCLAFFLLPGTHLAHASPLSHLLTLSSGCANWNDVLVLTICIFGICLSYIYFARSNSLALSLWLLIICWLSTILDASLQWKSDTSLGNSAVILVAAYSTGLLSTRLGRHPQQVIAVLVILASVQGGYILYYEHAGISSMPSYAGDNLLFLPSQAGVLAGVNLPLAIAAATNARNYFCAFLWMVCTALLFGVLIRTWQLGAVLAVVCSLTWMLCRLMNNKRNVLHYGIALIVCFFSISYTHLLGAGATTSVASDVTARSALWQRGGVIFSDHWLTGIGAGALSTPSLTSIRPPSNGSNIHSISESNRVTVNIVEEPRLLFLHWLDEFGTAGGVLFILFCIIIARVIRGNQSMTATYLGSAWLFLLVDGLFDTPFGLTEDYYGNVLVGSLLGATLLLASSTNIKYPSQNHSLVS